eukprot:3188629-Rhodomonas_salina.1
MRQGTRELRSWAFHLQFSFAGTASRVRGRSGVRGLGEQGAESDQLAGREGEGGRGCVALSFEGHQGQGWEQRGAPRTCPPCCGREEARRESSERAEATQDACGFRFGCGAQA